MDNSAFTEWLDYHDQRFVGVKKFVVTNNCGEAWRNALRSCSIEHAKTVSDGMFDGTVRLPDWGGYGVHPRIINRECRMLEREDERIKKHTDITARMEDGSIRFKCRTCHDDGVIQVYHPDYYRKVRTGNVINSNKILDMLTVSCPDCNIGKWKAEHGTRRWSSNMFHCRTQDADEVQSFTEFVLNGSQHEEKPMVAGYLDFEDDDISKG